MDVTLNLNTLISVGTLVIAAGMMFIALRKTKLLEKNHLETFRENFWKEFGAFRDGCNSHKIEEAKIQGALETEVKNLKDDVHDLAKKIEKVLNSQPRR